VLGGAEDLEESDLQIIDAYIMGGGKVLFAVDAVYVETRGSLEARAMEDKGLLAMLVNYGAVVRSALVLDRSALTLTFQTQSGNGTIIRSMRYPEWIGVQEQGGNPNHPVTARFGGLDLYWASPVELYPPPGVSGEILFSSTDAAWLQTERYLTNPNYISYFDAEAAETLGKKILGVSLSGVFPGFEDPYVLSKPSRIIVVGDTDFAGNIMQVNRGERRNLDFLIRAAEWLSSDDDIITIRNREASSGRLDRIMDREKRDKVMSFSRSINTIVIPLCIVIAGLFLGLRRANLVKAAKEKGQQSDI